MARVSHFIWFAAGLGLVACSSDDSQPASSAVLPAYSGPSPSTAPTVQPAGNPPSTQPATRTREGMAPLPVAQTNTNSNGSGIGGSSATEPTGAGGAAAEVPGAGGVGAGGATAEVPGAGGVGASGAPGVTPLPSLPSLRSTLPLPPTNNVPQPTGNPGNFRVLNWAGFGSAISYTFDDTNSSQIQNYQQLNGLGVPFSFYLITGQTRIQEINSPVWPQALRDGHEIGSHTRGHLNTGGGNLANDTDLGEMDIESRFGITVYTLAAPFGAQDYVNIASSRYLINRGTGGGTIAPNDNTNPFNLPCFIPLENAPVGDFNARVDNARRTGTWQTVLVHGFTGGTDGAFQAVGLGVFQQAVNYAKSFNDLWIDTVVDVGAYWIAQKLVSAAQPAVNGTSSTFRWTLPAHFPPGQFLRVTVSGGTLTQGGAPLSWDPHGFYEVALDSGSVTLSP
jgi:peptidoglycan/xylan/chitin deacetylase (PgdA/CDA1 family)